MANKKCQICFEGHLHHTTKEDTISFKGYTHTVKQPGLWCDTCGEAVLSGADLKATEKEIEHFKKQVKLKIAQEVKESRKKLNITQKKASDLFGGGINAFSRYERGEVVPPLSTLTLIRVLSKHPELLKEVEAQHKELSLCS